MKRDTGFRTVVLLAILVLSAFSLYPTFRVFSESNDPHLPLEERAREIFKRENPKLASKSLNLGLDLAGGTHIIVEIDKSKLDEKAQNDVLDRCLEIIRNRVDQYGLSEPVITRSGDNRIVADLAGMGAEDARRLIGATAMLEFKLVPEAVEFSPILRAIDGYLSRKGVDVSGGDTSAAGAKAPSEAESLFGKVVQEDTTSADPGATPVPDSLALADSATTDTATTDNTEVAADTAEDEEADFLGSRPFSALLTSMGRDIGVPEANVEKVRRILNSPEVAKLVPPKYQFLWGRELEEIQGVGKVRPLFLLKRRPEMTGQTISDAQFQHVQGGLNAGELEVSLTFKGLGPKEFARVTGANVGKQLAIVLDSVVYSAPVIQGRINGGRASITGLKDITEAKQLAVTLRAGALPAPMEIVELRSVGPTLGVENIRKGMWAAIGALVLVGLFMLWYYRFAGLVANIALMLNIILIFAVLSAFSATLTLPGLAGIVLVIGMAVDANVLIFERIREEVLAGKTPRAAVDIGYKKALSAILDSNITTFGTAAILYQIGVGPIKGFGLTLMIGLAASMYTAISVTRLVFDSMLARSDSKVLSIGKGAEWMRKIDLKVIPRRKIYISVSIFLMVVGFLAIPFRGMNFGIDFTGGNVYQVKFESAPSVADVRANVAAQGLSDPRVQTVGAAGDHRLLVYLPTSENDSTARDLVQKAVGSALIEQEDTVGPSVGSDLRSAAIWSILASMILIILYIWLRFGRNGLGYGIGGVLGVCHDALVTIGLFTLFGLEFNLQFIAAVLTIIGYSMNDSIIIFDRIRELTGLSSLKESFATRVNLANNQTFSRGVITHLTTFFTVGMLALLGGSSLRDFAVAMCIGVVVGAYSSISVASPFVAWWDSRRVKVPVGSKK